MGRSCSLSKPSGRAAWPAPRRVHVQACARSGHGVSVTPPEHTAAIPSAHCAGARSTVSETAETQPEVLAQHYTAAGLHIQALPYWQRAGQRALERSACEAVASLEQGLEVLQQLPDSRDTREQAIDLRLALRSALFPSRDLGRILACLREAEALAGGPRRFAPAGTDRALSVSLFYQTGEDQATMAPSAPRPRHCRRGHVALAGSARITSSVHPISPGDYLVEPLTATARLRRSSPARGATSASDRCSCLPCKPVPASPGAMPSQGAFARRLCPG